MAKVDSSAAHSSSGGLAETIKSAFPLLRVEGVADTTSRAPAIAQILLAVYITRRCYPVISARDIIFCTLFPTYLLLANRLRLESNAVVLRRPADHPHSAAALLEDFFSGSSSDWFQLRYMPLAATIGVVVPLLTIFGCPRDDVANAAIPHTFMLWVQIIGESLTMHDPHVHRYVALLVPLGFSAYRMNNLADWVLASISLRDLALADGSDAPIAWYSWGVFLSMLNLAFWTYNLFVTLLMKITPEYLADEKCESPDKRVVWIPFLVREEEAPVKETDKTK